MKRLPAVLMLLAALGGCSIFKGREDKKAKTPVVGERIPVLTSESDAAVDPTIAGVEVTVPDATPNADWAQPGGNAAKSMAHVALGKALAVAWTARVAASGPKARLAAAPVVGGGRVYVIDTSATIFAFRTDDGAKLWSMQLTDPKGYARSLFGGGVSFDEGRLYATNGVGDVAALDAATGKLLWKKRPGSPLRGSPTIANGNVYVVSQDNQLYALKAETGELAWNEAGTVESSGVFGVAAPAAAAGTVVAGFSSGELNAYRYENGRSVWEDALSRTSISTSVSSVSDIDASPVIEGGRVYAVGQGGRMVALELTTGQRQWELNIAGISQPWVAGDWLFVVTDDARLLCVQRATGRVRWVSQLQRWHNEKKKTGQIEWYGPVLAGDRLILTNSEGELLNVAVAGGKTGTSTRVAKSVSLPPVVAGETLYVLDDEGKLSAYRNQAAAPAPAAPEAASIVPPADVPPADAPAADASPADALPAVAPPAEAPPADAPPPPPPGG